MKIKECGGHFDQMLRQTRAHHSLLSQVADQKASMLTTISALATTILLTVADGSTSYRIPATIMLLTCVMTCCFAVLASMPSIKKPGRNANKNPLFNPLFFGDFAGLSYDEYKKEMERVLHDHEATYEAQVREIYAIGRYLAHRKFLYLRRAYLCLFTGLVSSALVWLFLQLESSGFSHVLERLQSIGSP